MSDRISCYMPELCIMYKPKLCRHKNQPSMKKIKYSNELTITSHKLFDRSKANVLEHFEKLDCLNYKNYFTS